MAVGVDAAALPAGQCIAVVKTQEVELVNKRTSDIEPGPAYRRPLPVQIRQVVEAYQRDRQQYHDRFTERVGPEAQETWRLVQCAAEAMLEGAEDLASRESVPRLRELLARARRRFTPAYKRLLFRLLDEEMTIWLGHHVGRLIPEANQRLWEMLTLTETLSPSWRAAAFLRRVSQCYLMGFDAECMVMCRSVLEGEFEAEISNPQCREVLGQPRWTGYKPEALYDLRARIAVARKLGRLTVEAAESAEAVREAARRVVHRKPKVVGPTIDLIRKTVLVIRQLSDRDAPGRSKGRDVSGTGGGG